MTQMEWKMPFPNRVKTAIKRLRFSNFSPSPYRRLQSPSNQTPEAACKERREKNYLKNPERAFWLRGISPIRISEAHKERKKKFSSSLFISAFFPHQTE